MNGYTADIKLLSTTGDTVYDAKDHDGWTPLLRAAANGHDKFVQQFVNTNAVDVNVQDPVYLQSPLSWATERGHEAVVRRLLAHSDVDSDLEDVNGQTPLSWAEEKGHCRIVLELLNYSNLDSRDKGCRTPLFWAAEKCHAEIVQLLLDYGKVTIDAQDYVGQTPMWWAARNGHLYVVRLLLDKWADIIVQTHHQWSLKEIKIIVAPHCLRPTAKGI